MSDLPLHVEAPAPVPEKTREIDRTGEPVFELRSVSHSYGRNKVIFDVSLAVWPGEVVGLVGDNGAGKSTLLKIFAGYIQPTSGTLRFMGKDARFRTPADARAMGIEAVYQDLAIVDQLSLWRNFFLGKEIVRSFGPLRILRRRQMRHEAAAAISQLGLTRVRSAEQPVWTLSGGERQSVAITRAMHFGAKLLLLDEPTAALSVRETRNVLQSIGHARKQGLGVLYIDHNMNHVLPVADRIVLLELGRVVRVIDRGEVSVEELQDLIAGPTHRAGGQ
jgi:simple sugar transport system ATP-binding protein